MYLRLLKVYLVCKIIIKCVFVCVYCITVYDYYDWLDLTMKRLLHTAPKKSKLQNSINFAILLILEQCVLNWLLKKGYRLWVISYYKYTTTYYLIWFYDEYLVIYFLQKY